MTSRAQSTNIMFLLSCFLLALCFFEATAEECVDKDPKCASYVNGHCVTNPGWGEKMCRKFCGYCGGTAKAGECYDKDPKCASYVKGHCTSNPGWGKSMCKKFCNYCDCHYNGNTYKHGDTINHGCVRQTCNNGGIEGVGVPCGGGFFPLPDPKCLWFTPNTHCCPIPDCPRGIQISYPSWWANYEKQIRKKP